MAKSRSKDFKQAFKNSREKIWNKKRKRYNPHRTFRRSYREDYRRDLEVPGLLTHAMQTFGLIFRNWRLFVPLIFLTVIFGILFIGLMNEDTYNDFQTVVEQTNQDYADGELGNFAKAGLTLIATLSTGGLSQEYNDGQAFFVIIIFLALWLITVYLLRHRLAGHQIKLRDGLYNALAPLISTLVIFAVIIVQVLPILVIIITYSTAVETDFLSNPFYALVFFVFACLFALLSVYLLSSSIVALIAVTAPGLYPFAALGAASDMLMGRRIKFIIRIIFAIFVLAIIYIVFMLPLIMLDMWAKNTFSWLEGIPFVSFCLFTVTVFAFIYLAAYFYLYYRRMLNYDNNHED